MLNRIDTTLAACLLAAALGLSAANPAAAQTGPTTLQKMLGGLGILELPNENPPDYRERAPLVVPPSNALIAPRDAADVRKYNPDWPIDEDKRVASPEAIAAQKQADEDFYSGRALRPGELARGKLTPEEGARREALARRPEAETAGAEAAAGKERYSPAQLGFKGWGNKQEERVVFTGEPERRSLTDPPVGLRTPSKEAPYGVVTKDAGPAKPPSFYERTSSDDDPHGRR